MRLFNGTLLRLLLFTLGHGLGLASRIIPSVRSQVTRTLTFEISTDDGVARQWHFNGQQRRITTGAPPPQFNTPPDEGAPRQWHFNGQQRRITTGAGRPRPSTNGLRFPSSAAAVRVLLSPHWARLIADGIQHGTT